VIIMENATAASPATSLDATEEAIVRALSRVLGRELPGVTAQTRLFEDLNLDSTSVLELLMAIEEDLDVEFDPDGLRQHHFQSVGALSGYVREAGV
jgi:acyl carrier protein